MKTIEEKAKAYDEALERANNFIENGDEYEKTVAESIFAGLRESGDERIRKKLIGIFTNQSLCDVYNLKSEDVIAYLERQKEHVPENEESGTRKEQKPIEFKNDELVEIIKGEFEGFRNLLKKKGIDYEPQRTYWEGFARLFDSSAREYVKEQKEQKPCEDNGTDGDIMQYIEEGEKRGIKEVISFPEKYGLQKKQKPVDHLSIRDELDLDGNLKQKPAECECTNDESEYDKGYREGCKFGLKQTQEYMLPGGKTFSGLIPCWVNAPSELQPAHKFHGKNVVVMHENNGGFKCTCIDDEKVTTFHLPEDTLFVEGWRKKPAEWSEEDEQFLLICKNALRKYQISDHWDANIISNWLEKRLKSLHPKSKVDSVEYGRGFLAGQGSIQHWKPTERQMEALRTYIYNPQYSDTTPLPGSDMRVIDIVNQLYEQLKKL